jgi:hypothetical protein
MACQFLSEKSRAQNATGSFQEPSSTCCISNPNTGLKDPDVSNNAQKLNPDLIILFSFTCVTTKTLFMQLVTIHQRLGDTNILHTVAYYIRTDHH